MKSDAVAWGGYCLLKDSRNVKFCFVCVSIPDQQRSQPSRNNAPTLTLSFILFNIIVREYFNVCYNSVHKISCTYWYWLVVTVISFPMVILMYR